MKVKLLVSLLVLLVNNLAFAQEFNCAVSINTQKAQSIDKNRFEEMKRAMQDFMNLRRWTEDNFKTEERINCNIVVTIDEVISNTNFRCNVQIQSSRPVYGTGYETIMLNYLDKDWLIEYQEGQPMDYNENTFSSNLTSLMGFYANIMLGLDYDSFSKQGGTKYLQKAQMVAQAAGASGRGGKGWQTNEGAQNRAVLLENLLSTQMSAFRDGFYAYHRLGLDVLSSKPEDARKSTLLLIAKMKEVLTLRAYWLWLNIFLDAKSNEIINVFTDATPEEKQAAYNTLIQVDPTKADKYQAIIK